MARYVFRDGNFRDPSTGAAMPMPDRIGLCVPYIVSDMEPYQSPVDGRLISGRGARRDDLKRHGCVEYEPSLSPTKGKFTNKAFAAKRGLKLSEGFL